jgi:hypothetical protein
MTLETMIKKTNSAQTSDLYRFTSDNEPTDEQLGQIMKEVAIDVRKRASIANEKFQEELKKLCIDKRKIFLK